MSTKIVAEVRRRLKREDVIGVVVSPSGRMVDARVDCPCPKIPKGGRLFSFLFGSSRLVEMDAAF